MKLPFVTEETEEFIQKEIAEMGGDAFAKDVLIRLRKENPNIAAAIISLAAQSQDDRATSICAAIVYRLLEEQSMKKDGERNEEKILH